MPRSRRIALLAVLALVGALGLAGCGKEQPGVAAYVGDHRYTERKITGIIDEIKKYVSPEQIADYRRDALSLLVLNDLGRRVANDRSIMVPSADYAGTAKLYGLPESAAWVHAVADWNAVGNAIGARGMPVTTSTADLREIYDAARQLKRLDPPDQPFDAFAENIRTSASYQPLLAIRAALRDETTKVKVTVNPRYKPLFGVINDLPLALALDTGPVQNLEPSTTPAKRQNDPADEPAPN